MKKWKLSFEEMVAGTVVILAIIGWLIILTIATHFVKKYW